MWIMMRRKKRDCRHFKQMHFPPPLDYGEHFRSIDSPPSIDDNEDWNEFNDTQKNLVELIEEEDEFEVLVWSLS